MKFEIGDHVRITSHSFVSQGYTTGVVCSTKFPQDARGRIPIRIPNYKYSSSDSHHWIESEQLSSINGYICPVCKQSVCGTIECG